MISPQSSNICTQVILVRHARTTYNEQGRYQGSSDDSVLTEKGYNDAFLTGLALKKYRFDAIYTSPLTRAQQTTTTILNALEDQNHPVPVYIDSQLTEICMADWQGLLYQEVKKKYTASYNFWQKKPHLFNFNYQLFPVLELFDRAQHFWQKVLHKHPGKTILIVAHGGTNRALISTATGLKPEYYHRLQQSNCGMSGLEFVNDNPMGKLKYLNLTDHLDETLPKLKMGKTGWRWLLLSKATASNLVHDFNFNKMMTRSSVDFLLTDDLLSNLWLDQLLGDYKILRLSLPRNYSIQKWQQQLIEQQVFKNSLEKASLVTGLIVASEGLLSQFLKDALTCETTFDIVSNLAVVHCPQLNHHSILQGLLPLNEHPLSQLN